MISHPYLEALKEKLTKDGLAMANIPLLRKILDAPESTDNAMAILVCAHIFTDLKHVYYAIKNDTLILANNDKPTYRMYRREGSGLGNFPTERKM